MLNKKNHHFCQADFSMTILKEKRQSRQDAIEKYSSFYMAVYEYTAIRRKK
jgi:hypothetical protein